MSITLFSCLTFPALESAEPPPSPTAPPRWSAERAWEWYHQQPWLVGFNFVPSTAVNDTEIWQAETFDPETIDRELGWAAKAGFNTCRVFLQYLVWEADPEGFKKRFERFLTLADPQGLTVMPVLFDDCAFAGKEPYLGKQDDPVPGVSNGGWVPSPGHRRVADRAAWPGLERYVKDLVGSFGQDRRVVIWDLYNEPGNSGMGHQSLPLVEAAFAWARETAPTQPLTVSVWTGDLPDLNRAQLELSDVISFHAYTNYGGLRSAMASYKAHGRPVVCTEWMARTLGARWGTDLPLFKQEKVGCYSWGLVNGRTQTQFPWGSPAGAPEPEVWFHDLFHRNGTPYDPAEILAIQVFTGVLRTREVVPTAAKAPVEWAYTTKQPAEDWFQPDLDDSPWDRGPAPFGTVEPEFDRHPGTVWTSPDLWLRRTIVLPEEEWGRLGFWVYHDDGVELYLNGVRAAKSTGYTAAYEPLEMNPEARAALKPGENLLAVHCHQEWGGEYVDVGLVGFEAL